MSVADVLLHILVVLIAAKAAAEVAERLRFPTVVGEIVAGIAIGPSALGLVGDDATLRVLGELGVILLLLEVGLQMNSGELRAVGRASVVVATIGVALPITGGVLVAHAFGHDGDAALFLGGALAATSVGITARVFGELRALARVEARTVLGAAVADDVIGLLVLTIVVRIADGGSVSWGAIAGIAALAVGFLVVTAAVGSRLAPPLFDRLGRHARSAGTPVAVALAFTLAFAQLANAVRLAPIVGAFVAGMALSGSTQAERIRRELTPVGHLFVPVFFLQIGIDADIGTFARPTVLGLGAALLAVATLGKLVAALGAVGLPGDRWLVGLGMLPRGEVGLIFATIGLEAGVLGRDLYAALLLVVLATTLAAPPLLRWRLESLRRSRDRTPAGEPRPAGGGWLEAREGVVDLVASPPDHLALHVGLEAALAVARAGSRPGPALLDRLGALGDTPLRWDETATAQLFELLLTGDPRSWRFLETTGLLEHALPELARALRRRGADPALVDPGHVLRFSLVEAIRDLATGHDSRVSAVHARLEHPEWLLLAALILETAGPDVPAVDVARGLVKRLDLGAAAEQEVAMLVGEHALLRAAARRVDGLEEEAVLQLAAHLDRPERARALYVLSVTLGSLEPWDRQRLDELCDLVCEALGQPDLTGIDARNLVERRRSQAARLTGERSSAAERVAHAPRPYVLAQGPADIARHAALLEPLPRRGQARVGVHAVPADGRRAWRVEVASRDRPGLLAAVSGVLAEQGLDVLEAVVATWPDGGALESFAVRGGGEAAPDPAGLAAGIERGLRERLASPPDPGASVTFDDAASPWYTLCEVRGRDRMGLLHSIAVGFAAAGADVHSARIHTRVGRALDRFELTDGSGRKLDEVRKEAVREALRGGVAPRRRWRGWSSGSGQRRDANGSRAGTRTETRPS